MVADLVRAETITQVVRAVMGGLQDLAFRCAHSLRQPLGAGVVCAYVCTAESLPAAAPGDPALAQALVSGCIQLLRATEEHGAFHERHAHSRASTTRLTICCCTRHRPPCSFLRRVHGCHLTRARAHCHTWPGHLHHLTLPCTSA